MKSSHEDKSTARTPPYSGVPGRARVEIQANTLKFLLPMPYEEGPAGPVCHLGKYPLISKVHQLK